MHTTIRTEAGRPGAADVPWRQVIAVANRIAAERGEPPVFGEPTAVGRWWAGGVVEEHPDARVVLPGDGRAWDEGILVVGTTDRGARVLRQAADELGLHATGADPEACRDDQ